MSEEFVSTSLFNEYKNVIAVQKDMIDAEQKRANERLKSLENETSKINELTSSIAIMAVSVENLTKEIQNQRDDINTLMANIDKRVTENEKVISSIQHSNENTQTYLTSLDGKISKNTTDLTEIKNAPAKTWSNIKTLVMTGSIGAIVSAVMAYLISSVVH